MNKVSTIEEYIDLVREAIEEVEDLRSSIEYDEEFMSDAFVFIDQLEAGIRRLYKSLVDGSHEFSKEDLPFMVIVRDSDDNVLPFRKLLILINEIHKEGFSVQ